MARCIMIRESDMPIHNIPPLYNRDSKILILGSFPSVKSREAQFFYGHPQNRFWRVMEQLFGVRGLNETEVKRRFLLEHGIAVWDVIASCDIRGSADDTIENVIPNDLTVILDAARIQTIYVNGSKAYELYERYIAPKLKERYGRLANAVRLPSTSPANAAWSLEKLVPVWSRILTGMRLEGISPEKGYLSMNDYCRMQFGKKLYKLSLNAGFTCPNRDGTIGTDGCSFCYGGSSDFTGTIEEQKARIADKLPAKQETGYIAYFGSYTGTYAPVAELKQIYREALEHPKIDVISIATRPDCLGPEVISLLAEMNRKKPVWIELGLQTIHEKTARAIRRGYRLPVYNKAVKDLLRAGIPQIITHVIIGLPGESEEHLVKTIRHVALTGSTGIKLSLLHVLEGTDLADAYARGEFEVLSMEEYVRAVRLCVDNMPPDLVIHRITGDGNQTRLIAPDWSRNKKKVLNTLNAVLKEERN